MSLKLVRVSSLLALLIGCAAAVGCSGDTYTIVGGGDPMGGGGSGGSGNGSAGTGNGSAGTGGSNDDGNDDESPLYLTVVRVWGTDGSALQYAKVGSELDLDFSEDDYDDAFELGGYSGITIQDGHVLIGDQETPFMHKYAISDDFEWEEVGEPLNLTDYYTESGDGFNDYFQAKKGNDQFFFYGPERTARLHFKVEEWVYADHYEDTNLPTREGWNLFNTGNRTGVKGFHDAIVWPFILEADTEQGFEGIPESYLAVYDGETFAESGIIEPSCPELQQSTMDEDGNLYFSTTWRSPLPGLYGESVPNCIVKVKPDGTVDEDFGENGEQLLEDLTGGLPGINFRYLGGGKAVANLLDVSLLEDADFDGPIQDEVFCQIENCEEYGDEYPEELWELNNPELYESYVIDMEAKTATKMTGYDSEYPGFGSYRVYWKVDERTFFMGYGEAGLALYELDLETAEVSLAGESLTREATDGHEYTLIARIR